MRGLQSDLQTAGFRDEELLAPEQALTLFFARARLRPAQTENVPIELAAGRVLARDAVADRPYPPAARSAMDGFAVASAQTPGAFRIVSTQRIAQLGSRLATGAAVRIPTGGVLPAGADAVVPIEDAEVAGETVAVRTGIQSGSCVVAAGTDMRAGETIVADGRRIDAAALGVLAALGHAEVRVYKVPLVGIMSSGDELIDIREPLPDAAHVRDSNRWAIAGALQSLGAAVTHFPIAPDDEVEYERLLRSALTQCDAVVLSGGSSVGERDFTPRIIERLGKPGPIVHGLKIKPGKPTLLGSAGGKPVIGLPGNPTSALMVMEEIGAPIIAQLAGARARKSVVEAKLAEAVRKRAGWTYYVPVRLEETAGTCTAYPMQMHSSSVSLLARAGGYMTLEESAEHVSAGTMVSVTRLGV